MTRSVVGIVFLVMVGVAAQAFAQNVVLTGSVRDPQGAAVPGADVRVTREGTGTIRTATSGPAGEFRVNDLSPGLVIVEVAAPGFRRRTPS
jgi:hypothetical protein